MRSTSMNHPLRRAVFQMHLWLGVVLGLLLTVVCLSGSLLVFRSDLQRAAFPQLLDSRYSGQPVGIAEILSSVQSAYPGERISGIDAPTVYRRTYLAYVMTDGRFRTVLADPGTGRVLGELPEESWIASLQALHFNLMLGPAGTWLNRTAALGLLLLVLSGAIIWWSGRRHWTLGLRISRGPWPDWLRNLHGATGAWAWIGMLMIAVSASGLAFPRQYRALAAILSSDSAPASGATMPVKVGAMVPAEVIRKAQEQYPREYISRVVLPAGSGSIYQINYARTQPTPLAPSAQVTRRFDASAEKFVGARTPPALSARIVDWSSALHVGNFAGNGVRVVWALLGLIPPVMFVTGALLWWRRVVRPWRYPKRPVM